MRQVVSNTADRTQELSFSSASKDCCAKLLEVGAVVVKGAVDEAAVIGMEDAARRRFYTTLHKRLLAKTLKQVLGESLRPKIEMFHSRTAQFDPYTVPRLLRSAKPSVNAMLQLYDDFFADERFLSKYGRKPLPNNVNIARHGPREAPFTVHQDSLGLSGLGIILQAKPLRFEVYNWKGSRNDSDFTFTAERGDLTVFLQRVGSPPSVLSPTSGNHPEFWDADGSEVHGGVDLGNEVRYRQALFSQQKAETA